MSLNPTDEPMPESRRRNPNPASSVRCVATLAGDLLDSAGASGTAGPQTAFLVPSIPTSCGRFLGADGVGADRRGGELGVAKPFLHRVERDPTDTAATRNPYVRPLDACGPPSPAPCTA